MILQQIAEHLTGTVAVHTGHVLALTPGDPTPAPAAPTPGVIQPVILPADPTTPKTFHIGKLFGWVLVLAAFLVAWGGLKVMAKTNTNGDLKQGFQISLGHALGIVMIVMAIAGGMGLLFGLFNGLVG
jgi:hypothetical protein